MGSNGNAREEYLVRGAYLACTCGTHHRRLNLPWSHGVYIKDREHCLMNAADCKPGEGQGYNIPPFGICQSPDFPREGKPILLKTETINPLTGEAYRDTNGYVIKFEENVKGYRCAAAFEGNMWQNTHSKTLVHLKGETPYPALTTNSRLECVYGGIVYPINSGQPMLDPPKADPKIAELPPDLQAEVDAIVADTSLDAVGKADKIVGVYESYLYSLAKSAFNEYDNEWRSITGNDKDFINHLDQLSDEAQKNILSNLNSAETRLSKELSGLHLDITAVLNNMGDDVLRATGRTRADFIPKELTRAVLSTPSVPELLKFVSLVNTNQPLDLKGREIGETIGTDSEWSIWAHQWGGMPEQSEIRTDYTGNYLFGYFGAGYFDGDVFREEILLYGAGAAQALSDGDYDKWLKNMKDGNYGDNAGDSDMIKDGIISYEHTH